MKVAITGASGWLGRATLAILKSKFSLDPKDIFALGSARRQISVDGQQIEVYPISHLNEIDNVELFVHLAYKTRDKIQSTLVSEYARENRRITELASQFISTRRPDSVITISSGAVFNSPSFENLSHSLEENPYGFLKLEEEERLKSECEKIDACLIINRLWGLSGRDVQNRTPFALFNFLEKASSNLPIEIRSSHEVWRRYVDARELMELCMTLAIQGQSILFDSGGPLVEIGELASLVVKTLGSNSEIHRNLLGDPQEGDFYYSKSQRFEELFVAYLGREPADLQSQILESSRSLTTIARGIK